MKKYVHPDEEALDFENAKHQLLPNYFKKIGLVITILCFIGLFCVEGLSYQFLKYGALVGMLIIVYSKEKIEDELIEKIRMRSFLFAFSMSASFTIFQPFTNYFIGTNAAFVDLGGNIVLVVFFVFYMFYFKFFNRMTAY